MPILTVTKLGKTFYGDKTVEALHAFSLDVEDGEFVALIGPSGCGKSTFLRIVAGLDTTYEGTVLMEGQPIEKPSIDRGFIFQEHRLFPWLTVERNIAADLPLKKAEIRKKVDEIINLVKLNGFEKSYPKELSGGMSQRVAIARALMRHPHLLLLDEPFGALDAFTRKHLQEALLDIWRKNKITMILVTHDIDEAIFLADRVVVMAPNPGKIREIFKIGMPHPRVAISEEFLEYRKLVLSSLDHLTDCE